jgi:phospholipid transport system substrate-binding protein
MWTIIACLALAIVGGPTDLQGSEVDKLEGAVDAALDVLYLDANQDYTYEQKQAAVRRILESNYDLVVIVRRALARNWKLLDAHQQVQVTELITQLVVKAYIEGMDGRERPTFAYGEVVEITSKRLEIPVVVTFPKGKTYNILYRLGRLKSGWQIYDIVGEGISFVSNYRQQFDDHFRKGDGAQLIKKLEKLLKEGELNGSTKI